MTRPCRICGAPTRTKYCGRPCAHEAELRRQRGRASRSRASGVDVSDRPLRRRERPDARPILLPPAVLAECQAAYARALNPPDARRTRGGRRAVALSLRGAR